MKLRSFAGTLLLTAAIPLLFWSWPARADAVTDWNENAANVAAICTLPQADPFHESRLYAMVHIAIHDAANAIDRRSRPYAYNGQAPKEASLDAAAAAAAHAVLNSELARLPPEFSACVVPALNAADALQAAALAAVPDGQPKTDGIAVGEAAAEAIIARRLDDNSVGPLLDFAYDEGTSPGEYRFTTGFPFAAAPTGARSRPSCCSTPPSFGRRHRIR